MTRREKLDLIGSFESAFDGVAALVAGMSDEALAFLPPIPDAWSANDHLVHILDAEISISFRLRASMAQPGFVVPVWKEEEWHALLHYEAVDGRICLGLAAGLRKQTAASIRANADLDWKEFWIRHPVMGRLGLANLLELYRDHAAKHEGLIKRAREAWEATPR